MSRRTAGGMAMAVLGLGIVTAMAIDEVSCPPRLKTETFSLRYKEKELVGSFTVTDEGVVKYSGSTNAALVIPAAQTYQDDGGYMRMIWLVNASAATVTVTTTGSDAFYDSDTSISVGSGESLQLGWTSNKWYKLGGWAPEEYGISGLLASNAAVETSISNLHGSNTTQNTWMSNFETTNTAVDTSIGNLHASNTSQNTWMSNFETTNTGVWTEFANEGLTNAAQDTWLANLDASNTTQNTWMENFETTNTAIDTSIGNLCDSNALFVARDGSTMVTGNLTFDGADLVLSNGTGTDANSPSTVFHGRADGNDVQSVLQQKAQGSSFDGGEFMLSYRGKDVFTAREYESEDPKFILFSPWYFLGDGQGLTNLLDAYAAAGATSDLDRTYANNATGALASVSTWDKVYWVSSTGDDDRTGLTIHESLATVSNAVHKAGVAGGPSLVLVAPGLYEENVSAAGGTHHIVGYGATLSALSQTEPAWLCTDGSTWNLIGLQIQGTKWAAGLHVAPGGNATVRSVDISNAYADCAIRLESNATLSVTMDVIGLNDMEQNAFATVHYLGDGTGYLFESNSLHVAIDGSTPMTGGLANNALGTNYFLGPVGIGTNEPAVPLHVLGNTQLDGDVAVTGKYSGDGQGLTNLLDAYAAAGETSVLDRAYTDAATNAFLLDSHSGTIVLYSLDEAGTAGVLWTNTFVFHLGVLTNYAKEP